MWRRLEAPDHKQPDLVREGCVKMRDYVVRIRKLTAPQFRSPKVEGLAGTSSPLLNWKLRAYAAPPRDFDPTPLQVGAQPPLVMPVITRTTGAPTNDQGDRRHVAL